MASLSTMTAACLPHAEHVIFATWCETEFRLPGAIIRITENGAPEAQVGRIVSYSVEARGASAAPEAGAHRR